MPIEIKMPALSPTMEEGTLAKWLVKEGDTVSAGDILAEIETDKATMEFEAVDEGTIQSIAVPAGTSGVKVGTVIATLSGDDEAAAAARQSALTPAGEWDVIGKPHSRPNGAGLVTGEHNGSQYSRRRSASRRSRTADR